MRGISAITRARKSRACSGCGVSGAACFFCTSAGAEIDLLQLPGRPAPWAVEIKHAVAPKIDRGFHAACETVAPERRWVVYGGVERFPIAAGVEAIALTDLCAQLGAA